MRHVLVAVCAVALVGACEAGGLPLDDIQTQEGAPSAPSPDRLSARPRPSSSEDVSPGMHRLPFDSQKESLVYVPDGYRSDRAAPLAVVLHGAGGGGGGIRLFRQHADEEGLLLLAPRSRGQRWDVLTGGFGPDVEFIDRALRYVFRRYAVDPERLAIAGFSDGASYALSLGLSNGDLFTHVIALSPGFMAPAERRGRPRVFVAHGEDDNTLPMDRTSRKIVPELRDDGYPVRYEEFPGGHTVDSDVERTALRWFLKDGTGQQ